jgi:hypothetical protein
MRATPTAAKALAAAIVAGPIDADAIVDRAARLLGKRYRWLRPLALRIVGHYGERLRPRRQAVTQFLMSDAGFTRAWGRHELSAHPQRAGQAVMSPTPRGKSWNVPVLCTQDELAKWMGISTGELLWFADARRIETKTAQPRLRNYHYRILSKRFGKLRLIEAPKPRLKAIQHRVLDGILNHIPPHPAAHGFIRQRSTRTFAAPHIAQKVVLRIDLEDYFPSIRFARVQAIFRLLGYADVVADALAGLCTNAAPLDVWNELEPPAAHAELTQSAWRYWQPHLPQGAPTSPALANLCSFRLDTRLAGLARAAGASYSRYADDLAFSGGREFERVVQRFHLHACAIALEEGFRVHHRKTRIMRQGVRQQLAGIVVNVHANVRREEYDRLKATLVNCLRHGLASQNREQHPDFRSHLAGRISYVTAINPLRGEKLRRLWEQIA